MGQEQQERPARTCSATSGAGLAARCVAIALLCGGCQHVPPAPIDPAANATRLSTRSLAEPTVRDALAARGLAAAEGNAWSLDQLTLAAWLLRTDLNTARAEVEAARATTGVQAQRPK